MEKLYESKYIEVLKEESLSLGIYRWKSENFYMKDEEYKEEMQKVLELFSAFKPENVMGDIRNSEFVVLPEFQDWINEQILSKIIAISMRRMFLVLKDDPIQKLNYEQIMEDDQTNEFQLFYFDTDEKVYEWLRKYVFNKNT